MGNEGWNFHAGRNPYIEWWYMGRENIQRKKDDFKKVQVVILQRL